MFLFFTLLIINRFIYPNVIGTYNLNDLNFFSVSMIKIMKVTFITLNLLSFMFRLTKYKKMHCIKQTLLPSFPHFHPHQTTYYVFSSTYSKPICLVLIAAAAELSMSQGIQHFHRGLAGGIAGAGPSLPPSLPHLVLIPQSFWLICVYGCWGRTWTLRVFLSFYVLVFSIRQLLPPSVRSALT